MSRRVVLASASPARRRLLHDAGLRPDVIVSGVDEDAITIDDPASLVQALADAKAEAVAATVDDALVIGCDSLFVHGGRVLGKPADDADAASRWRTMAGGSGELMTGHCVIDTRSGARARGVACTVVRFADPAADEIAAYIASGEPLRVAGAFTIDGLGAPFVEGVEGDPSNVAGLSLPLLRRLLADLGVRMTDLW